MHISALTVINGFDCNDDFVIHSATGAFLYNDIRRRWSMVIIEVMNNAQCQGSCRKDKEILGDENCSSFFFRCPFCSRCDLSFDYSPKRQIFEATNDVACCFKCCNANRYNEFVGGNMVLTVDKHHGWYQFRLFILKVYSSWKHTVCSHANTTPARLTMI